MKQILLYGVVLTTSGFMACAPASGNRTGHEYMPDMAHSIAVEANVYNDYSLHTWDKQSVKPLTETSRPRNPVTGTIARGYTAVGGVNDESGMKMRELMGQGRGIYTPVNGSVPYYYADTEEERARANKDMVMNPFPITKAGLAKGKELYLIYCGICHGEKGAGNGYLVRDGGKYPAQPANLMQDTFLNSNNGRIYHAIMYGKNVMGSYADKLSYEERWQVIHFIRSLEAETKSMDYNENSNTFMPAAAMPDSMAGLAKKAKTMLNNNNGGALIGAANSSSTRGKIAPKMNASPKKDSSATSKK